MSKEQAKKTIARFAPDEPIAERLVHLFVAMASELAATRERVDTLERMLAEAGVVASGGADAWAPDAEGEAARAEWRNQWREQFLDRAFEELLGEIAAAKDSQDETE